MLLSTATSNRIKLRGVPDQKASLDATPRLTAGKLLNVHHLSL